MPKIFISYRREDSKHAVGRLHAALTRHVRNPKRDIFIDIDNIPRGVDFVDHLDGQVAQCDVMLAVIGPSWLTITDAKTGKRRLDDPHDFVRIEVASALKRGIPVVPVVLDDTKIPVADDLPDDLRLLARRNGERLEHESFEADVTRLIKNLPAGQAKPLLQPSQGASRQTSKPSGGRGWVVPAVGLLTLVLGGAGAWAWLANPGDWRGTGIAQVAADSAGSRPAEATKREPTAAAVDWTKLDRTDASALRRFIQDFDVAPEGEMAKLALGKLDAEAWALASSANTSSGYESYLQKFPFDASPPGAHATEATTRLASAAPTTVTAAVKAPKAAAEPPLLRKSWGVMLTNSTFRSESGSLVSDNTASQTRDTLKRDLADIGRVTIEHPADADPAVMAELRNLITDSGVPASKIRTVEKDYYSIEEGMIASCENTKQGSGWEKYRPRNCP